MTVKADTPIVISTVIVIAVVGYLLFSACEKGMRVYEVAVASMASVAKCPLVRALVLPETLLK